VRGTAALWMAIMAQTIAPVSFSQTWTFFEGAWHDGNVPIMGPRTHAAWLGSVVFDGARAFEGLNLKVDPRSKKLVAAGPVIIATAVPPQFGKLVRVAKHSTTSRAKKARPDFRQNRFKLK